MIAVCMPWARCCMRGRAPALPRLVAGALQLPLAAGLRRLEAVPACSLHKTCDVDFHFKLRTRPPTSSTSSATPPELDPRAPHRPRSQRNDEQTGIMRFTECQHAGCGRGLGRQWARGLGAAARRAPRAAGALPARSPEPRRAPRRTATPWWQSPCAAAGLTPTATATRRRPRCDCARHARAVRRAGHHLDRAQCAICAPCAQSALHAHSLQSRAA
jgi:hypothetical protein